MKSEYSRNVEMLCPVCGGKTFQYDSEVPDGPATCISCKRTFTREELLASNGDTMAANLEELQKDAMQDLAEDLRKKLKESFGKNYKNP